MRPQKVDDTALLLGIMSIIRDKGYEGTSLADIAAATGLKKASLYHRFPGGKKEIAQAVLQFVDQWMDAYIVSVVADTNLDAVQRLDRILENISGLYENGNKACILKAVSSDAGLQLFQTELNDSMLKLIHSFRDLALAMQFEEAQALKMGTQSLIRIQGSLVVAKGLNDPQYFTDAIASIRAMFLNQ